MDLRQALSGCAGLPGVQWLLTARQPLAALRRELGGMMPAPRTLGACRIRRAKFRAGRRLNAYYDVQLSGGLRPVAVTWELDRGETTPCAAERLEAEAMARGVATPFRKLEARIPRWGMHVQVSPLDPEFPQLVRWLDPEHVRSALARAGGGAAVSYAIHSIRYRPGQRHVLCYERVGGRQQVFAKFYPGEEGRRAYQLANRLAEWLRSLSEDLASVKPLAYLPEEGVVLYPRAPGVPLSEQFGPSASSLMQDLYRLGVALRRLHSAPASVASHLKTRTLAEVVRATARSAKNVAALSPAQGAALNAVLGRALEVYEGLPQDAPAFAYGDLKADHVWTGAEGLTLIDTDSCVLADRAADLGKFLADLQWWYSTRGLDGIERAQGWFLAGYGPNYACAARARVFEAVLLASIGMRRVPLYEPDWAERIQFVTARAARLLERFPERSHP